MSAEELSRFITWSPWYKNTAPEIDWDTRLRMQSVVQYYTTHSISSTLNLQKEKLARSISKLGNIILKE